MSYTTYVEMVGTGAPGSNIISVPFPYIRKEDVKVYVDTEERSFETLNWPNDGQVQLPDTAASLTGKLILVRRETPIAAAEATFTAGGLDQGDLNLVALQGLYADQEQRDLIGRLGDVDGFVRHDDPRLSNERTPLDSSVSSAKIQSGAVTNAKLGTGAVTLEKLSPDVRAALEDDGEVDAKNVKFFFDRPGFPTTAVSVHQRLGQEVYLTDEYVIGSGVTDFTAFMHRALDRSVAQKRPLVIPADIFTVRERFIRDGTAMRIYGLGGKYGSALYWPADATSTGLKFTASGAQPMANGADARNWRPDTYEFQDFCFYTGKLGTGDALDCSFYSQVINFPPGNPNVWDRFSTRFRAVNLAFKGYQSGGTDGWNTGITCSHQMDAIVTDCQFSGRINGSEPNYTSAHAIKIGAENGFGHPCGPRIFNNNIHYFQRGVICIGNEGSVVADNQIVGVNVGIEMVDDAGRPGFDVYRNHVNASHVCIRAAAAQQPNISDNLLYHMLNPIVAGTGIQITGSDTTDARSMSAKITGNIFGGSLTDEFIFTGISIFECDHAIIDHNIWTGNVIEYDPFPTPSNVSNQSGISLASTARWIKVGEGNVFPSGLDGRHKLVTTLADSGVENRLPGLGARYTKSSNQGLSASAPTVITFQNAEYTVGAAGPLTSAGFTVPIDGLWSFTFGYQTTNQTGGSFTAIKKNGTGANAVVSDSFVSTSAVPHVGVITTGLTLCAKGDVFYPSHTAAAACQMAAVGSTFFEARRAY